MTEDTINKFIYKVREARGLTLRDVSNGSNVSTVSRFENGQVDIAFNKLLDIQINLGIDLSDIQSRGYLYQFNDPMWGHLMDENWDNERTEILSQFINHRLSQTPNTYWRLIKSIVSELIEIHAGKKMVISESLVLELSNYFNRLNIFTKVDYYIFDAVIDYVGIEYAYLWIKQEYVRERTLQISSTYANNRLLDSMLSVLTTDAEDKYSDKLVSCITELVDRTQLYVITRYNYEVAIAVKNVRQDRSHDNRKRLASLISTSKILCPSGFFEYFMNYSVNHGWLETSDFENIAF